MARSQTYVHISRLHMKFKGKASILEHPTISSSLVGNIVELSRDERKTYPYQFEESS